MLQRGNQQMAFNLEGTPYVEQVYGRMGVRY